jgi:hypothetical protein
VAFGGLIFSAAFTFGRVRIFKTGPAGFYAIGDNIEFAVLNVRGQADREI